MGGLLNNQEKDSFSDKLLNQLIFNNDYIDKINEEGKEKKKKDLKKEKPINIMFYQKELNIPMNKINKNINLKTRFNLFDEALGNRIGIILLFNEERKNCLIQIKELFKFLYDSFIEEYQQYIKKFCLIYLMDSMEEKELFQLFIEFSEKNVKKIKYPLILFIQKDNDHQQINESCIKLIIEDLNDHEYFKDILLSFLQEKIEGEKSNQIISNDGVLEKEINKNDLIY